MVRLRLFPPTRLRLFLPTGPLKVKPPHPPHVAPATRFAPRCSSSAWLKIRVHGGYRKSRLMHSVLQYAPT